MSLETGHPTLSQMEAAYTPGWMTDCRSSMEDHCRKMLAFYERRKNTVAADSYRQWLAELESDHDGATSDGAGDCAV